MKRTLLASVAIMISTLILLTACSAKTPASNSPESSVTSGEDTAGSEQNAADSDYKVYNNTLYSYSVPYPKYFASVTESDSGDGATFTTADTGEEMKVWGQYNIDDLTGQTLYDEALTRVSEIVADYRDDESFYVFYQGGDEGEGGTINFFEFGCARNGIVVRYLFKYPATLASQYDDIIKKMTTELVISDDTAAQIPNPFTDCQTIADAEKITGFAITVPEKMPSGYSQEAIRASENGLLEIIYVNGENEITIRKGKGSEDISGDYNAYQEIDTTPVDDLQVTTSGKAGNVNVATWLDGEYTFAICANSGKEGIGMDVIKDMIRCIK